jgi:hypothetical protein
MSFGEADFSSSAENNHEKGSKKAIHISLSQKIMQDGSIQTVSMILDEMEEDELMFSFTAALAHPAGMRSVVLCLDVPEIMYLLDSSNRP